MSGDRNAKYYHVSMIVRRNREKIGGQCNEDGVMVTYSQELRILVVSYFAKLLENDVALMKKFPRWIKMLMIPSMHRSRTKT